MPGRRGWSHLLLMSSLIPLGAPALAGGEASYPHRSAQGQEFGEGARSYWLYEPAGPRPERAPVVVFLHGWLAVNPGVYGAWIEHLARGGHVVIAPRYQDDWRTPPAGFLPNAVAAVRDALDVLQTAPGRVRPDRSRFALIGHSAGGNLAAQLAASARDYQLPAPRAVVSVTPGEVLPSTWPDLASIPAERCWWSSRPRRTWSSATSGPGRSTSSPRPSRPAARSSCCCRSDRRGTPALVADHVAPTAGLPRFDSGEGPLREFQMDRATVDALDLAGLWRLADLTLAAGFEGIDLDAATRNGALLRNLGRRADGRAIRPPLVGDDLDAFPRVVPAYGLRLVPWPSVPVLSDAAPEATATRPCGASDPDSPANCRARSAGDGSPDPVSVACNTTIRASESSCCTLPTKLGPDRRSPAELEPLQLALDGGQVPDADLALLKIERKSALAR